MTYDVAVIGAGVFGAWTAYQLRLKGASVLLLDAYGPGNSRASSGGESRMIRLGYGPDEIYSRSSQRSMVLWQELFAKPQICFGKQACCGLRVSMIPTAKQHLQPSTIKCEL
jgi:glycine/D-amino acid oxidase-like deaminating enzyme